MIVILIHYKPRIAVAILDLQWINMTCGEQKDEENCHIFEKQFKGIIHSKTPSCRKIKSVFRDVKWCLNAPWGPKGLIKAVYNIEKQGQIEVIAIL